MRLEIEVGRAADENLKIINQQTGRSAQSFFRFLVQNIPASELLQLLSSYQENLCKTTTTTETTTNN